MLLRKLPPRPNSLVLPVAAQRPLLRRRLTPLSKGASAVASLLLSPCVLFISFKALNSLGNCLLFSAFHIFPPAPHQATCSTRKLSFWLATCPQAQYTGRCLGPAGLHGCGLRGWGTHTANATIVGSTHSSLSLARISVFSALHFSFI